MPTFNLRPYQFQIGDVVFGKHTNYQIEKIEIQSYQVNNQDSQVIRSNEIRMGIDTEQAGPITFQISVLLNKPNQNVIDMGGGHLPSDLELKHDRLLTALQKEWKAEEVRQLWGELKPLLYCDKSGQIRRIYGRPRKFQYTPLNPNSQWRTVQCEFARIDSKTHMHDEWAVLVPVGGTIVTPYRDETMGDADAWVRFVITGPATQPVIQFAEQTIHMDMTLPAGKVLEINTYPWTRRIIDSDGISWRAKAIGPTPYLDKIKFQANSIKPVSWTASGTTGASALVVLWRDAYHVV